MSPCWGLRLHVPHGPRHLPGRLGNHTLASIHKPLTIGAFKEPVSFSEAVSGLYGDVKFLCKPAGSSAWVKARAVSLFLEVHSQPAQVPALWLLGLSGLTSTIS